MYLLRKGIRSRDFIITLLICYVKGVWELGRCVHNCTVDGKGGGNGREGWDFDSGMSC